MGYELHITTPTPTADQTWKDIDDLSSCCLHKDSVPPEGSIARVLRKVEYEGGYGPEGHRVTLFVLVDGRYGVFEEWEDSTGHG